MRSLLFTNALATYGMVATIWFVQLVHYPLFASVGSRSFVRYESLHQSRISWIVIPLMLIEAATTILLVGSALPRWERWTGVGLVLLVWGVTFFLSVPEHARLSQGFDVAAHRRLVGTNWIRTIGWTLRGGLVTLWLWRATAPRLGELA